MPAPDETELFAVAARYIAQGLAAGSVAPHEDRDGYTLALTLAERGGNLMEVRELLGLSSQVQRAVFLERSAASGE